MTIRTEQVFLSASPTTSKLIDVPAGPVQVILAVLSTGASIAYGPNQASLTSTTGSIISAGQSVTIDVPLGAGPQTLYATGIGGTAIASATTSAPN